jgi:hypothetical protein
MDEMAENRVWLLAKHREKLHATVQSAALNPKLKN